jgi:hypothetical protein
MNDTRELLTATNDGKLTFAMVAAEKLALPAGLFDAALTDDGEPLTEPLTLSMPVIVRINDKGFLIVDGCKRFAALRGQGRNKVACGIIETPMDETAAGLLRIGLNAGRQLKSREKLMFIRWLKSKCDTETYHAQAQGLLLTANERHDYEQLIDCKPWLVEAALRGTLDMTVAPEMNHLPENDAQELITLFARLSFSRQMQRELAEWLPEIAFIRKIALGALLGSEPLAAILSDKRLNNPQKAAGIHDRAHAMRFPLYAETKKAWVEQSRKINPDPAKITFQPSPWFEKNSLEIKIKITDAASAQQVARKLAEIDLEQWQQLVDPTAKNDKIRGQC